MKYIKTSIKDYIKEQIAQKEEYLILKKWAYNYVKGNTEGFNSYEDAVEYLDWFFEHISRLPTNIELYRILQAGDKNEINKDELGIHFTDNKANFTDNFLQSLGFSRGQIRDDNFYIVTIKLNKNQIDLESTISTRLSHPYEDEYTLKENAEFNIIDIEPFTIKNQLNESHTDSNIFYHGSTDRNLAGKKGIHIGTKLAATQALEARIGVPTIGEWDGTRKYAETLLAGKKTLEKKDKERGYYCTTGYNCGGDIPEEDYYPTDRDYRAKYSDGTPIPFESKPIIFPVKITGQMTNSPYRPHSDEKANSMMLRNLKLGNAKSGYYYENIGEDEGSISAVVPDASFLKLI